MGKGNTVNGVALTLFKEDNERLLNMIDDNKYITHDVFKSKLLMGAELVGQYGFPRIKKVSYIPRNLIPFNTALKESKPADKWVHFFIDDYHFERVWNSPYKYLALFKRFEGVIGTDFSMYADMSKSQQIWNCYRNRVLTSWLQMQGIKVIPVVEWSDKESLDWCLDGLPIGSTVAIGMYGCNKSDKSKYNFLRGLEKICRDIEPKTIICYGKEIKAANSINKNIIWHDSYCKNMKKRLK